MVDQDRCSLIVGWKLVPVDAFGMRRVSLARALNEWPAGLTWAGCPRA